MSGAEAVGILVCQIIIGVVGLYGACWWVSAFLGWRVWKREQRERERGPVQ